MDAKLLKEVTKYSNYAYSIDNLLYYSSDRTVAQYKMMRKYPMCWLGLQFLKLGLADIPLTVDCEDATVKEVTTKMMNKIWRKLVKEATECLDHGFKAFEIRYKTGQVKYNIEGNTNNFEGILLKQPKGLDGETITILVQEDGSLRGFRQTVGTQQIDVLVDERKCLLFTHNLESGQYYGMSALEPAYPFWYDANLNRRFHMRWLERKGTGFYKGLYPVGTTETADGEKDNQDIMLEILENMTEGNVVALPSGRDENGQLMWDITFLNDEDKTDPFITRARYIDEMILKALVIPEKALTQGEVGARASIEAFQNMFMQRKQDILNEIVTAINLYLLPQFIEFNFGKNIDANIIVGSLSDSTAEVSNVIIQKLIDKDKVKVDKKWLISKTGIPIEYVDEIDEDIQEEQNTGQSDNLEDPGNKEKEIKENTKTMADIAENSNFWRPANELEKKYNLMSLSNYLDTRKEQFIQEMVKELQVQADRIKRYIEKNLTDSNYIETVNGIEVKKSTIKKILKTYLVDISEYVIKNTQEVVEYRFSEVDNFIGFRIDLVSDKLVKDIETAIKLQVGNDVATGRPVKDIIDRIGNTTIQSFMTTRMTAIAETEIGFILNKSVDYYIKQNITAVKKGLIPDMKKIERVRYSAIMDSKVCEYCKKLDGMVTEYNTAVYQRYSPPIHYNCRCVWLPITAEEIADSRYEYTDLTTNEKGNPLTVDDVQRKLGEASLLRTFCECGE